MWAALNAIDAKAVTLFGIEQAEKYHAQEMARMREEVAKIGAEKKVA